VSRRGYRAKNPSSVIRDDCILSEGTEYLVNGKWKPTFPRQKEACSVVALAPHGYIAPLFSQPHRRRGHCHQCKRGKRRCALETICLRGDELVVKGDALLWVPTREMFET
jgi:hypothetical protein